VGVGIIFVAFVEHVPICVGGGSVKETSAATLTPPRYVHVNGGSAVPLVQPRTQFELKQTIALRVQEIPVAGLQAQPHIGVPSSSDPL